MNIQFWQQIQQAEFFHGSYILEISLILYIGGC